MGNSTLYAPPSSYTKTMIIEGPSSLTSEFVSPGQLGHSETLVSIPATGIRPSRPALLSFPSSFGFSSLRKIRRSLSLLLLFLILYTCLTTYVISIWISGFELIDY